MSAGLDARHVRHAFARAAGTYEGACGCCRPKSRRVCSNGSKIASSRRGAVLDAGSGPGTGAGALAQRFPDAEIVRARHRAADAASRRRTRARCASVRACRRGCTGAAAARRRVRSRLFESVPAMVRRSGPSRSPSSRACCAPGACCCSRRSDRLRCSSCAMRSRKPTQHPHVSRFVDMHDIGDALLTTGFRDPVLERDDLHADLHRRALAHARVARDRCDQRRCEAPAHADRQSASSGASSTRTKHSASTACCPRRTRVVYAQAFAPLPGQPRRTPGGEIASFPIERLRGSRR